MLRSREVLLMSLLALAVAAPLSRAQEAVSHARIVRVSHTEGTAQLNGQPVPLNSPVTEGAVLVTGTDGLAEVQFEDGSVIRLASETQITFPQLARLSSGEAITRVDLDQGEAEFHVMGTTDQVAVQAGGKNILFKQPGRYRILSTNSSPLEIAVWRGEAAVHDRESGQEVAVKKNETFTLSPTDREKYTLESSVFGDDLDQWSDLRDQALSSAQVSGNYTYAPSGGSYIPTYGFSSYGFNSCPYGLGGYGYWQPFWYASPGYCWNSGFYNPWNFGFVNPWFFPPPVFFVVTPPVRPRRLPPIHPPTVPTLARTESGPVAVRPGIRTFRFSGGPQRTFNDDNFQRSVPRVESALPAETAKPREGMQEPVQAPSSEMHPVTSRPVEPLIAPGQRSAGNVSAAPSAHVTHPAPPLPATHSPAPSAPPRPYSPPRSVSAPPPSRSPGFSGASPSRSSPSPSRSGGSGRH
jgi:FecR protein